MDPEIHRKFSNNSFWYLTSYTLGSGVWLELHCRCWIDRDESASEMWILWSKVNLVIDSEPGDAKSALERDLVGACDTGADTRKGRPGQLKGLSMDSRWTPDGLSMYSPDTRFAWLVPAQIAGWTEGNKIALRAMDRPTQVDSQIERLNWASREWQEFFRRSKLLKEAGSGQAPQKVRFLNKCDIWMCTVELLLLAATSWRRKWSLESLEGVSRKRLESVSKASLYPKGLSIESVSLKAQRRLSIDSRKLSRIANEFLEYLRSSFCMKTLSMKSFFIQTPAVKKTLKVPIEICVFSKASTHW